MGLDMYLMAKRANQKSKGVRGACDGLFPLSPKTDKEEIGYWRKAYLVMDKIVQVLDVDLDDINCEELKLSEDNIIELLEWSKTELPEAESDWDREDLETSVEVFTKALDLIRKEQAEIYFMCWY